MAVNQMELAVERLRSAGEDENSVLLDFCFNVLVVYEALLTRGINSRFDPIDLSR
jgi:hypothetical protein